MARLNFIVAGAQKSGSTYLAQALAAHPCIVIPREESPVFESPYYEAGAVDGLCLRFGLLPPQLLCGIKRPDYLGTAVVPGRIAAYASEMRIVVVLRDPVDRAISAYKHYVTHGHIPAIRPDRGLRMLLAGRLIEHPRAHEIFTWGNYSAHLRRYLTCFPQNQLHVIRHDHLATNPASTIRKVLEFLGVSGLAEDDISPRPVNAGVVNRWELRGLRLRSRALFSRDPLTGRRCRRHGAPLHYAVAAAGHGFARLAQLRPADDWLTVSDSTRKELRDYYRPDVSALGELLEAEFEEWLGE